jgi:hypothetical protein
MLITLKYETFAKAWKNYKLESSTIKRLYEYLDRSQESQYVFYGAEDVIETVQAIINYHHIDADGKTLDQILNLIMDEYSL